MRSLFLLLFALLFSCAAPRTPSNPIAQIRLLPNTALAREAPSDTEITSVIANKIYSDPLFAPDEIQIRTEKLNPRTSSSGFPTASYTPKVAWTPGWRGASLNQQSDESREPEKSGMKSEWFRAPADRTRRFRRISRGTSEAIPDSPKVN